MTPVHFLCVKYLRKHDIIEIGLKEKGNVLHVVQPTMCSTLSMYDNSDEYIVLFPPLGDV